MLFRGICPAGPALLAMLFAGAPASAQAQSSPVAPPHPAWLTDATVFRFLLKHVTVTESRADKLLALGKDDSGERHLFKKIARLTDAEEALLKSTAADLDASLKVFDANAVGVMSNVRAQHPCKSALPASAVQQLQSLDAQRRQIVINHMAALQSSMTPDRFQHLYSFAYGFEGPRIKRIQPGSKPPAGARVPSGGATRVTVQ